MRTLPLLVLLGASPCLAGDAGPAAPALNERAAAQASTKQALGETKLTDDQVDAVYADIDGFAHRYAQHVLAVGGPVAHQEDLDDVVEQGLRRRLEASGMALTQQDAIMKVAKSRAKAALDDYDHMIDAQVSVKDALEKAQLEDDVETSVLHEARDFVDTAHAWVRAPGVPDDDRELARDVVEREFSPVLTRAEVSDRNAADIKKALVIWLEARAALEGEGMTR